MDELSLLSDSAANQLGEVSDSGNSSRLFPAKNPTHNAGPSGSKFCGVMSQPNGNWGAQIYTDHQLIWLGTFRSENEAAMAYDSAEIKLRNRTPWTDVTVLERSFQGQFNTETVLAMSRDRSYEAKFTNFLRVQDRQGYHYTRGGNLRPLFQKELTPSDVGKLNRLVIPKKHAVKFFPKIVGNEGVDLVFYDREMMSWNFRYCFWVSSQSHVFTRGWNSFTKANKLRSKDRVIISCCDQYNNDQKLFMIDVEHDVRAEEEIGGEGARVFDQTVCEPKKAVRLFGVQIC